MVSEFNKIENYNTHVSDVFYIHNMTSGETELYCLLEHSTVQDNFQIPKTYTKVLKIANIDTEKSTEVACFHVFTHNAFLHERNSHSTEKADVTVLS